MTICFYVIVSVACPSDRQLQTNQTLNIDLLSMEIQTFSQLITFNVVHGTLNTQLNQTELVTKKLIRFQMYGDDLVIKRN